MQKLPLNNQVRELLELNLLPEQQRLAQKGIDELANNFFASPYCKEHFYRDDDAGQTSFALLGFIANHLQAVAEEMASLNREHQKFVEIYRQSPSTKDQQNNIITYLKTLGFSRRHLRGDRRAFKRNFDFDAAVERFQVIYNRRERFLVVALERLGAAAPHIFSQHTEGVERLKRWQQLQLPKIISAFILWRGDVRVRIAAMNSLRQIVQGIEFPRSFKPVSENIHLYLYRSAMNPAQNTWLQCEALALLSIMVPEKALGIAHRRLQKPIADREDLFPRQYIVRTLSANFSAQAAHPLMVLGVRDPSPYVRQGAALAMINRPLSEQMKLLIHLSNKDPEQSVRAAILSKLHALAAHEAHAKTATEILYLALKQEKNAFALRSAIEVIPKILTALISSGNLEASRTFGELVVAQLTILNVNCENLSLRRKAALAREEVSGQLNAKAQALYLELNDTVKTWPLFKPRNLPGGIEPELLGRTLARISENDFGFDIKTGSKPSAVRWQSFRARLWRIMYEYLSPAGDKRQAHRHTVGRIYHGDICAPSQRMAELSKTKVPGEPLFIPDDGDWRPFLPLLDQIISSTDHDWPTKPVTIYTSEGVTSITPPSSLRDRLKAKWHISRHFEEIANLRNWREGSAFDAKAYLESVTKLGFKVDFRTYNSPAGNPYPANPAVTRFFSFAVPIPLVLLGDSLYNYFISIHQNSLRDLVLFIIGISGIFIGRHLAMGLLMRNARNSIALVVGGWGTRGKSGTERIKAAVFSAKGYHVLSKTTGCEAMFVDGYNHSQQREMFLFRPYDKATIWEQVNVVRIASKLGAEVFLWECMGLTPGYVRILQRFWMRDDLSTITNTYPDHEDLQGPAGYDIPTVMVNFIPKKGYILTTEEEMLPILQEGGRRLGTPVEGVTWLDAGLLTPDVLERFPYEEHPNNIALVLEMSRRVGIEDSFALKAMADAVVADLGVLKIYPITEVRGRRFEFVNGMSANERMGCMGNWQRLGFDSHNPLETPGVWTSGVVNNRADRVPRSKVFSAIMVEDVSVDRHILIGTNLEGMRSYLEEDWQKNMAVQTFENATESFTQWCRRLRIPMSAAEVNQRLNAMLEGLGLESLKVSGNELLSADQLASKLADTELDTAIATDVVSFYQQYRDEYETCDTLAKKLAGGAGDSAIKEAKDQLWQWFDSHLIFIDGAQVSGEQILYHLISKTPPGYLNKCMGLQNIKGPGLDFIYRWQYWNEIYNAGQMLLSNDRGVVTDGLKQLAAINDFGQLSEEYLRAGFAELHARPIAQDEVIQNSLATLEEALNNQIKVIADSVSGTSGAEETNKLHAKLNTLIEKVIDASDAVKRRKQSDRIYKDLCDGRISRSLATQLLQKLVKRQKGGWYGNS